MKKIFPACLSLFLILPLLSACSKKDSTHSTHSNENVENSVPAVMEVRDSVISSTEDSTQEETQFPDHLVTEYDNIKVYANYCLNDFVKKNGDDMTAIEGTYLIRYVNDIPQDSMVVKGPYQLLSGKKNVCTITVGNETVNFDISHPFKKFIDVRFAGVLPGCQFFRLSKHYQLNENSFPTDFQINIAIRDDDPEYIRDFINKTIRDNVAFYFDDGTDKPKIPLFNIKEGDFSQMSRYYYNKFRSLYKKQFIADCNDDGIPFGPCYSYQCYAYPVWENSDSSLVTWKFYNYTYMSGAHGGEEEYFLTFDNNTGRILGANDFFGKKEFRKAIDTLTRQLNAYFEREPYGTYSFSADLGDDSDITAAGSTILNETIGKNVYPRPALTRKGIIFTYQTYEKGSFADGILHFTQPFKKDFKLK